MAQQSADNYALLPVIELDSVDSTNNYALNILRAQKLTERQPQNLHGTAIFAHEQYAGKGQRGKAWASAAGKNIHTSIIIKPTGFFLHQQFTLIAAVAVAVRNFFERYAQSDIYIKWPNDIYFKDRKAGGILIENIISGANWKWAVAGIGLNINQTAFKPEIQYAVSLKQITGKHYNCLELAKELRQEILKNCALVNNGQVDSNTIITTYNKNLYKQNQIARLKRDDIEFEALVKKVTPTGQLVVHANKELAFDFGEVSWVIR